MQAFFFFFISFLSNQTANISPFYRNLITKYDGKKEKKNQEDLFELFHEGNKEGIGGLSALALGNLQPSFHRI